MMEPMSEVFPPSLTFLASALFAQQICRVVGKGSWGGVTGPKFRRIAKERLFFKAGVFDVALTRISRFFFFIHLEPLAPVQRHECKDGPAELTTKLLAKAKKSKSEKWGRKRLYLEVKTDGFPAAWVLQRDMNATINQRKLIRHVDGFIS